MGFNCLGINSLGSFKLRGTVFPQVSEAGWEGQNLSGGGEIVAPTM